MAQAAVDVDIDEDTIDMMGEDSEEDRDEAGTVVDYRRPISELPRKALEWSTCRILEQCGALRDSLCITNNHVATILST